MISTLRRAGCLASALLVLLAAVGCGPGSATVSGRVTYKGAPLPSGDVLIYGANGKVQSGPIGADGNYAIYKAPVGDVKMAVVPPNPSSQMMLPRQVKGARKHPGATDDASMPPIKVVPIPERYNDPDKSGLNFTLKSGEQTIDLDLTP
jgi:hypothetical protein